MGEFSASIRICSLRSFLLSFFFSVIAFLEPPANLPGLDDEIGQRSDDSRHLLAVDQRLWLHHSMVAIPCGSRKMAAGERSELDPRPGGQRLGARVVRVLLEVVAEHARELAGPAVVGLGVGPRRARVEEA